MKAIRIAHLKFIAIAAVAVIASACAQTQMMAPGFTLSGAQEVPPVQTSATGSGTITVAADGAVSGKVVTKGIAGTAAHIHAGAEGANGPVVVPLTKNGDNEWVVPAGAKLTADQLKTYQARGMYVNVHSEANKGGELRAQLKP